MIKIPCDKCYNKGLGNVLEKTIRLHPVSRVGVMDTAKGKLEKNKHMVPSSYELNIQA